MLVFLLAPVLASAQPATLAAEGASLFSDRRDVAEFQAEVNEALPSLGECASHTGGLDYGELTLSFMIGKRGETENISVRSNYVLPRDLVKCLEAPVEELRFGRGDVSVAKLIVKLPTGAPTREVEPEAKPKAEDARTASGGGIEPATP